VVRLRQPTVPSRRSSRPGQQAAGASRAFIGADVPARAKVVNHRVRAFERTMAFAARLRPGADRRACERVLEEET
jgi:hypothetical protein